MRLNRQVMFYCDNELIYIHFIIAVFNYNSRESSHLPTSANFHQDIILHTQVVHQWQEHLMHSLILVWFLSSFQLPNSQCGAYNQPRYKHQCYCVVDCILQILFSSYRIFLSFNHSSVTKIRSISISSPCHFYFVLYCFIEFSWSSLCYGRCKADIHRMSCTLVFALIRVRKHWRDDITQGKQ